MKFVILSRKMAAIDHYVRDKCGEPYIWISIHDLGLPTITPQSVNISCL